MPPKPLKTRCSGTMTESAYFGWIRSALRAKSLRWLPRAKALELARRPYKGANKLQKWEYQCAICKQWGRMKDMVVDHFPKSCGSITCVEDIGKFATTLFCEVDNLRVLDKECHDIHTLAESMKISFEDAKIEKQIIAITKQSSAKVVAYLKKHGYNGEAVSNPEKRRKLVSKIVRQGEYID